MPSWIGRMPQNEAEHLLNNIYREKELWKTIPPLQSDTIDASIVIPVYNSEKYLATCLDSILKQKTEYNYEVICINDGSKDSSLEILNHFQQQYPEKLVIFSQANQGISAARNQGIALAKGKYIGFIDNDDYVTDDYIQKILDKAFTTDADIVQVGHIRITPEGKRLASINKEKDLSILPNDKEGRLTHVFGYIWGGMLRKKLFQEIRFPVGFWYEDIITRLVMMRLANRIECLSDCLYYYLVHGSNASKTIWKAKGYKYMDQFYLGKALAEYSNKKLGLPCDDLLYGVLSSEYGTLLWLRTRSLGVKLQKAIYIMAAQYMNEIRPKDYYPQGEATRRFDKIFKEFNFWGWYFYSLSCMCGVKIRNNAEA